MKIVLYGALTNNTFDRSDCQVDIFPTPYEQLRAFAAKYPEHEFHIVTTPGHLFLVNQGEERRDFAEGGVYFRLLAESSAAEDYVRAILNYRPELAIAMTFPGVPVDGNGLMDAVIAEKLCENGIKTAAHSIAAARIFSDKWLCHQWLEEQQFPIARAVHVPQFFYCLEGHKDLFPSNAFKALVFHEICRLSYPVVIKGCFSSASIGVRIAENFDQTAEILMSTDGSSDLLVEEKIEGVPFGAEIHGFPGQYSVTPPFKLSTGADGISSATDNLKGGPVSVSEEEIEAMQKMLMHLAEQAKFQGNVQVDLFLTETGWKILEINPRISGMSILIGAAEGHSILETLIDPLLAPEIYRQTIQKYVGISLRAPLQELSLCRQLTGEPHVFNIWQNDNAMLQNCQITLGGYDSAEDLYQGVLDLKKKYGQIFTDEVVDSVKNFFEMKEPCEKEILLL